MLKNEGYIQPFPGIYSKKIIPFIEKYMLKRRTGNKRISEIVSEFYNINFIDFADTGFSPDLLYNINTIDEYHRAVEIYKKSRKETRE